MGVASSAPPYRITAASAFAAGLVYQLPNGRAAVNDPLAGVSAGERPFVRQWNPYIFPKAALQILDGDPIWWDFANGVATPLPPLVAGKSFYLGTAIGDAAVADANVTVDLNQVPRYLVDSRVDGGQTALVGGASIFTRGAGLVASFSTATEAQKADWLSRRSFAVDSNWILEAWATVDVNADAGVVDFDLAVALATHASDLEAVDEFVAFNFALGADLNLRVHSDDGTTDVAPTDTTVDWAVGTPIYLKLDGRNPSSVAAYANGVRVLSGTTFSLADAEGPLKALLMLEKSSDDTPGSVTIDQLTVRTAHQRG
jgi:hypothetical protein